MPNLNGSGRFITCTRFFLPVKPVTFEGQMKRILYSSGLMTKQGVSILGSEPIRPFLFDNVNAASKADQATVDVERDAEGRARVEGYTVIHSRDGAKTVALVCGFEGRRRTLRVVADPGLAEEGMNSELCGREVLLESDNALRWL